jgi:uncharacterized protein YifE (UPF0438 family)
MLNFLPSSIQHLEWQVRESESETERERECVCVREREREREKEREWGGGDGTTQKSFNKHIWSLEGKSTLEINVF